MWLRNTGNSKLIKLMPMLLNNKTQILLARAMGSTMIKHASNCYSINCKMEKGLDGICARESWSCLEGTEKEVPQWMVWDVLSFLVQHMEKHKQTNTRKTNTPHAIILSITQEKQPNDFKTWTLPNLTIPEAGELKQTSLWFGPFGPHFVVQRQNN